MDMINRQSITDWSWGIIAPKQHDFVAHVLMRCVGFLCTFQHIQWLVCLANRCETLSTSQPNLHFMGISWSHISLPPTSQFRAIQHLHSVYANDVYIKYTVDLEIRYVLQLTNYTSTISIQSESTTKKIRASTSPNGLIDPFKAIGVVGQLLLPHLEKLSQRFLFQRVFWGNASRLQIVEWIIFKFM